MEYLFRKAIKEDLESVFKLYENRVSWMDQKGLHQWNKTEYLDSYPMSYYQKQLENGQLYVAENRLTGKISGAVVLLSEDERWTEDRNQSAYYIHNLVTNDSEKGVGKIILKDIECLAETDGKEFLRLDCAVDNAFLNTYYESNGFMTAGKCRDGLYNGIKREKCLSQR